MPKAMLPKIASRSNLGWAAALRLTEETYTTAPCRCFPTTTRVIIWLSFLTPSRRVEQCLVFDMHC